VDYLLLTLVTASRWICAGLWLYLWKKEPTPLVLASRILVVAWFLASDFEDGGYARAHGLESRLGKLLDHGADAFFTLAVFVPLVRDVPLGRRRRRGSPPGPGAREAPNPPAPESTGSSVADSTKPTDPSRH
jgi:hypothetical protein